jgi:hypothetical protein
LDEIFDMDSSCVKERHRLGRWTRWSLANGIDMLTVTFVSSLPGKREYDAYTVVNSAGVSGRESPFSFSTNGYSKLSFLLHPHQSFVRVRTLRPFYLYHQFRADTNRHSDYVEFC